MPNQYCSRADVLNRLTSGGYVYAADRDTLDGIASETEAMRYIDDAIAWAGDYLDEIVPNREQARASGNTWLRSKAVDLCVWQVTSHGGRTPPESFQTAFDNAMSAIERVRAGMKIPGLAYPIAIGQPAGGAHYPRIANVC